MTCSLCDRPVVARGWCRMHYLRQWRQGNLGARPLKPDPTYTTVHRRLRKARGKATDYPCANCGQPACDWSYRGGGGGLPFSTNLDEYEPRCRSCHGRLDSPWLELCSAENCDAPHHSRGMCRKHYDRWRYNQRVLQNATPFTPRKK